MIENEAKRLALQAVLTEISKEMDAIADSRDQIKEIIVAASSTFDIPKPLLRKVARIYYNKNLAAVQNELAEVKELYVGITKTTTSKEADETPCRACGDED